MATLLLGILGMVSYLSERETQLTKLQSEAISEANELAAALALPLWNFDRPQVDKIIESSMDSPQISGVVVRQADVAAPGGTAIYAWTRDTHGSIIRIDPANPATGQLVLDRPILASGQNVGSIRLFVTCDYVWEQLHQSLLSLLSRIIGLDVILILTLYILLNRTVIVPLRAVEKFAAAVSSGGRSNYRADSANFSGEIASLHQSIELMVRQLDERYAALLENQEQYRLLFDQNMVGIIICDVLCDESGAPIDFRLVQANPAVEKLTGLKPQEQIGKTSKQVGWKWPPDIEAKLLNLAFSGEFLSYERFNESIGRYYEVQAFSPKRGQFALIFNDVSERKRAEAVLMESERMRMVAGLAAGMAHEINNPLAGVLQNSQVVLSRLSPDNPANRLAAEQSGTTFQAIQDFLDRRDIPQMLEEIRSSGERAAQIVDNMLSFSRKSESDMTLNSLADLLDRTLELAGADFKNIQITRQYDPQLPPVPVYASEIQQVILNLLTNSAQAMLDRGPRNDPPRITLRTLRQGDSARIEVEDNGCGMPEEIRKHVFEPFFTTKRPQAGTGLGLFVSYFIITRNHGGSISVESSPGSGTKFIITLPLQKKELT